MVKRSNEYISIDTLPARTSLWLKEIRGATRSRKNLAINPHKCALLVIDMLNYFAHPEGDAFLPASTAIIPQLIKLISLFRELKAPVFFIRHSHDGDKDLGMLGKFYNDYIKAGTPDAEIISELAPTQNERIIRKKTYDAFYNTDLELLLKNSDISQVLISGVLTHLCCETTARSAFVRGFEVYFSADATASSDERLHFNSLLSLADGVAVVLGTEEILKLCKKNY